MIYDLYSFTAYGFPNQSQGIIVAEVLTISLIIKKQVYFTRLG